MMIQKNYTEETYENEFMYHILVGTDSSIERDIILKHLAQAQEEYQAWIRKFTKPHISSLPVKNARVEFSMKGQPKIIDGFSATFCKCGLTHYFKTDTSGRWLVKCPDPDCNFETEILINKFKGE